MLTSFLRVGCDQESHGGSYVFHGGGRYMKDFVPCDKDSCPYNGKGFKLSKGMMPFKLSKVSSTTDPGDKCREFISALEKVNSRGMKKEQKVSFEEVFYEALDGTTKDARDWNELFPRNKFKTANDCAVQVRAEWSGKVYPFGGKSRRTRKHLGRAFRKQDDQKMGPRISREPISSYTTWCDRLCANTWAGMNSKYRFGCWYNQFRPWSKQKHILSPPTYESSCVLFPSAPVFDDVFNTFAVTDLNPLGGDSYVSALEMKRLSRHTVLGRSESSGDGERWRYLVVFCVIFTGMFAGLVFWLRW